MKGSSAIRLFVQDIWAGRVGKGREALVGRAHGRGRGRRARASREPGAPLGPPGSRLVLRSFLPRLGIIGWSARLTRHHTIGAALVTRFGNDRSDEHTSELQSLMRISYAVFCSKKKTNDHSNEL